jgi:hypothetical protein
VPPPDPGAAGLSTVDLSTVDLSTVGLGAAGRVAARSNVLAPMI